eukprot:8752991-Alexandrium_andersonii.AAC.1
MGTSGQHPAQRGNFDPSPFPHIASSGGEVVYAAVDMCALIPNTALLLVGDAVWPGLLGRGRASCAEAPRWSCKR